MNVLFTWIESILGQFSGSWQGYVGLFGLSGLLGITHTFGPGHGKSLLLGVLVAESRRIGHALKMAVVIGLTHMADVLILSTVSIFLVSAVPVASYSNLIGTVSGLGIIVIGLYRVYDVIRNNKHAHSPNQTNSSRDHEVENYLTAFLYSLVPCPAAWVLFLACLGIGEPVTGIVLLVGFSLGLLATIGAIAGSIVYSLEWGESFLPAGSQRIIALVSGLLVTALGGWLLIENTHTPEPSLLEINED